MSDLYDEMARELEDYVKMSFSWHDFDKEKVLVTDGSDETYQGRYDVSDTTMVFIEVQGEYAHNKWKIDTAEEQYTDAEYAEMIKHHSCRGLEDFKELYGEEWKKIALECQFENGGFWSTAP